MREDVATKACQDLGQIAFTIPFTDIPATISLSGTFVFSFSSTNDVAFTFPPAAGLGFDVTVGAPEGPNVPVAAGMGKNLSVGTFLTPSGPKGVSGSLGISAGWPVTMSPTIGNRCGYWVGKED